MVLRHGENKANFSVFLEIHSWVHIDIYLEAYKWWCTNSFRDSFCLLQFSHFLPKYHDYCHKMHKWSFWCSILLMTFEFRTALEYCTFAKPSSGPLEGCQARVLWALPCSQALNDIPVHISHNGLRLRLETQLWFPAQRLCGNQQRPDTERGLCSWQQLKRAWGNLAEFIQHQAAGKFQENRPLSLWSQLLHPLLTWNHH